MEAAADRWVERGILVTGGQSESTGDLLADSWLFDLTNLGVAECPWISLGSSGSGSASSSLGWDPTRGRFVRVGGFVDDGVSQYTDDGVYTATVQELVDGLGWTAAGALPDRTVSTSSIGDGDAEALPWPVLDCEEPYSRAAVAATASWTAGESFPGLTQVLAADVGGAPTAEARSVVLHELVYELFAFRHLPEGGVDSTGRWWAEGSARLVEHLRLSDGASLRSTATALATAACAGYGDDLELEADDSLVAYEFGAYTVAQLYWSYLAAGGTAADFWVEVQALHSTAGEIDSVALDDFMSTQLGLPRFYAEWVMADRRGTPLVSLTDASPDNSACLDTGPCEPTSATMTISQVQDLQMTTANGCLHDAPLFTDVPWFLQCHPPGYAEPTFFECDAGATTLFSSMPRTLSGASAVVALTVDPLMAAVAWPTWIRPIANDGLLPGGVPAEGVYATGTRAYVVCARPGDADCGGDNDGDGWSMDAECNDAEPTWNPGVTPGPLAGPDTNCDGW